MGSWAWSIVPIAPSATTTRVARASRRADTRVRLSVAGVGGNEAMKGLPWGATAVGFASSRKCPGELPKEGARRQGSRDRPRMVGASTTRTKMAPVPPRGGG
ncbi:hypothetical protein GCM10010510_53430 [Streptomyces anandii JCM 4720]|nr:hypothetical protein GCM10010510_53430 [Streptomyces anandii JCM 4720]